MLNHVWYYVIRKPDEMFRFIDRKAVITYYRPWHTVVYLEGAFESDDKEELMQEVYRAAASKLN
jgi:hypothetical protein